MDFESIESNIILYLEKQRKNVEFNPLRINLTIKKFDAYIENFHREINGLLKQENKNLNLEIEKSTTKPSIHKVNLESLPNIDQIKRKLSSISNKLLNELERNQRDKVTTLFQIFLSEDTNDGKFQYNVLTIIEQEQQLFNKVSTLQRLEVDIKDYISHKQFNSRDLKKKFQEIQGQEVIKEFKELYDNQLSKIINNIISQYKDYLNKCLEMYKKYYSGDYFK